MSWAAVLSVSLLEVNVAAESVLRELIDLATSSAVEPLGNSLSLPLGSLM